MIDQAKPCALPGCPLPVHAAGQRRRFCSTAHRTAARRQRLATRLESLAAAPGPTFTARPRRWAPAPRDGSTNRAHAGPVHNSRAAAHRPPVAPLGSGRPGSGRSGSGRPSSGRPRRRSTRVGAGTESISCLPAPTQPPARPVGPDGSLGDRSDEFPAAAGVHPPPAGSHRLAGHRRHGRRAHGGRRGDRRPAGHRRRVPVVGRRDAARRAGRAEPGRRNGHSRHAPVGDPGRGQPSPRTGAARARHR